MVAATVNAVPTTDTSHHSPRSAPPTDAAPDDHELDDQELAALRASVRCGRSLPLMHLSELDEVFTQRRRHRAPIVLCGADVADPDHHHDDDGHDCPGCADCLRYCPDCARSAVRWSEQRDGTDPNAEGGTDEAGDT